MLATSWIFDVTTNNWTSGPRLLTGRRWHGCFHIKENNVVTKVVVMGGTTSRYHGRELLSSTEILDVNTMTWGEGPPLPISLYGNKGVQSVSYPYLGFTTGGSGTTGRQNKIYGLRQINETVYTWEEVHSMTKGRYRHSAVNAPHFYNQTNC